ncbi:MAG: adenylyl-sulfate kinase [Cryomorphaceae bacterium]|nr:MAG: adenylyl-sulfate kinase [Cryomorphaceae bacterium]
MSTPLHIHPIFNRMISRERKEQLLGHRGLAIWMTGLSGSGKSTIGLLLEEMLHGEGVVTRLLDGDNVRAGINNNLGFSDADRTENIRRIAEVNRLFTDCGVVVINCFVSPTRAIRQQARTIIGNDFMEVFVDAPLEVCEQRDVKGLYQKARAGEIRNFTGIDAPFEAPEMPEVHLRTANESPEQSAERLFELIIHRIQLPSNA